MPEDRFKRYQDVGSDFLESARARAEEFLRELARATETTQRQASGQVDELVAAGRRGTDQILDVIRREVSTQLSQLGLVTQRDLDALEQRLTGKAAAGAKAAPAKKGAAKKAPSAKKTTAKKAAAKKAPAKEVASQSPTTKAPAEKVAAQKAAADRETVEKGSAQKGAAKKAPLEKSVAPRKSPAKKAAGGTTSS